MRFSITHLATQKLGNRPKEYEDWFASDPPEASQLSNLYLCLSITDGATESIFSSLWAKLLAEDFILQKSTHTDALKAIVAGKSEAWTRAIESKSLPWYAEEKARYGAFATVLGAYFFTKPERGRLRGRFRAVALGDSCLFQIRDGKLRRAFPIQQSNEFDSHPALLSTRVSANRNVWEKVRHNWGGWKAGDTFFFATDALSAWFLQQTESGRSPFGRVLELLSKDPERSRSNFVELVQLLRDDQELKNDDVTCSIVELHDV